MKKILGLLAVALIAASCGDSDRELSPPAMRIVSLSPTATEMLFAIGAGELVVAVDSFSNYPPEAPLVADLGAFDPNIEAIAAFEPTLVVISFDPGDLTAGLEALGIEVLLQDASFDLDGTYAQIEQLGALTDRIGDAAEVVLGMQTRIDELLASLPEVEGTTFFHELGSELYSTSSITFVGQIYALVGLSNIADDADPDGYGYPQLSAEYILDQDPDIIFLADTKCCAQDATTVAARPGWSELSAVQNGSVILLDDDIASRWGPRIVEFLEVIVASVNSLEKVGA